MKFSLFVFILLLISINSYSYVRLENDWNVCDQAGVCKKLKAGSELFDSFSADTKQVRYSYLLPLLDNCKDGNCWIFLGEVADSANLYVNNKLAFSTSNDKQQPLYVRHMSFLIPLQIKSDKENKLEIELFEMNQTLFGLRTPNIVIGSYDELLIFQAKDFFKRTGITLLSSFSMLICLFLSLGAYSFRRRKAYLYSAFYSLIAVIYLLSFSEFPRFHIDALYASGPLHFSLRLMQDASLFLLIHFFFKKIYDRYAIILIYIYFICIATLLISWNFNQTYNFYLYTMYGFSILLLHPMMYALYMTKRFTIDQFERMVLLVSFVLLALLQMNDLLFFWQITRGFFFIKVYPPFVVVLLFLLLLRRDILERTELLVSSELGKIATQVAHDIKSPLTALKILKDVGTDTEEKRLLFNNTVERINNIAEELLFYKRVITNKADSVNISKLLEEICNEKEVSFSLRTKIHRETSDENIRVKANNGQLKRILSNLINNAVEADAKNIKIKLTTFSSFMELELVDDGKGISDSLVTQINSGKYSVEFNGHGLGTSHANEYLKLWGGSIKFSSESGRGTKVLLKLLM